MLVTDLIQRGESATKDKRKGKGAVGRSTSKTASHAKLKKLVKQQEIDFYFIFASQIGTN